MKENVAKPDDLDWSYVYTNEQLENIFAKYNIYKYVAHVTRLENNSLQKQILFTCERKKFSRDRWQKKSRELNLDTTVDKYKTQCKIKKSSCPY